MTASCKLGQTTQRFAGMLSRLLPPDIGLLCRSGYWPKVVLGVTATVRRSSRQFYHLEGSEPLICGLKKIACIKLESYMCMYNVHCLSLPLFHPNSGQQLQLITKDKRSVRSPIGSLPGSGIGKLQGAILSSSYNSETNFTICRLERKNVLSIILH